MSNAWDDMKRAKEEQYFNKKDKELLEKKHHEIEIEDFKKHFMNHCPKCGEKLEEVKFHGVNIDRCNSCKGIWLDDGELDAIEDADKAQSWFEKFWGDRRKDTR